MFLHPRRSQCSRRTAAAPRVVDRHSVAPGAIAETGVVQRWMRGRGEGWLASAVARLAPSARPAAWPPSGQTRSRRPRPSGPWNRASRDTRAGWQSCRIAPTRCAVPRGADCSTHLAPADWSGEAYASSPAFVQALLVALLARDRYRHNDLPEKRDHDRLTHGRRAGSGWRSPAL
jgi:hypothetical protein